MKKDTDVGKITSDNTGLMIDGEAEFKMKDSIK